MNYNLPINHYNTYNRSLSSLNCLTTKRRVLTRRGVVWLGQTCNLRCHFCYFLDRINAKDHPEHPFMSLEKAKTICSTLVEVYGNRAVDIQGGEPMLHQEIYALVEHCRGIGLYPTLITNALMLDKLDRCIKLKDSGIRDLLISVHGLGEVYDNIVGVPGASARQMEALKHLQEVGIPFRFNCVLSKDALLQLNNISRLAISSGARVVNFIAFNPFEDQQKAGKRSLNNVPRYAEIAPFLNEALDILSDSGVEANVRYLPICIVEKRHRKSMYNFQQLPYDLHEWDYASWSWTGMPRQRMRDGDLDPPVTLEEATFQPVEYSGVFRSMVNCARQAIEAFPQLRKPAARVNRMISGAVHGNVQAKDMDQLYIENAKLRAFTHCKYTYSELCGSKCSARNICDGFHGDYAALFGVGEAAPITDEPLISDPKHFIGAQDKLVEQEDYAWAR